ncbi:MAG: hypothetical protein ACOCQG_00250 [Candidatus Nanoarchaeia archaeon]
MSKPTLQELLNKRKEQITSQEFNNQKTAPNKKIERPSIKIVKPAKCPCKENKKIMQSIAELANEVKELRDETKKKSSIIDSMKNSQNDFFKEIRETIKTYHTNLKAELDEIERLEKKIYEKKEEIFKLENETLEKEKEVNKRQKGAE